MRTRTLALLAAASSACIAFGSIRLAQADEPAGRVDPESTINNTQVTAPATAPHCVLPAESFGGKTPAQWRAQGPAGLAELMQQMKPQIDEFRSEFFGFNPKQDPERALRFESIEANIRLLDQVAQQRDAFAAGLYWYTDLDEAKAEAKRTGKPILSLRMLGKLCDEYSCANSRFFRTVLYADESVGSLLRDKVVLHWQSVRPVPVITIDMGDGRTIKRTITGNSAHYVLDANGRVVDCLPGLYGADTFEQLLGESLAVAEQVADQSDDAFVQSLKAWHQAEAAELDALWVELVPVNDGLRAQLEAPRNQVALPPADRGTLLVGGKRLIEQNIAEEVVGNTPTADQAGLRTVAKSETESVMFPGISTSRPAPRDTIGDDELWQKIAERYIDKSRLDEASVALMRKKTIPADQAFRMVISKTRVEDPMLKMVRNFEGAIALDTAINEHMIHREIHNWFIAAESPMDLDKLNSRVYAELFLTPDEDPWLGLVPADTYSALDTGGLIK